MKDNFFFSKNITLILVFFLILFICFLSSCSPRLTVKVGTNNNGNLTFVTETDASVESAIRSLLNVPVGAALFDPSSVYASLIESGILVTSISFPTVTGIQMDALIPDLTNAVPKVPGAVTYKAGDTGKNTLTITFNAEILKSAVAFMPPETAQYLELLMAPVFTDEIMSADEYIELIAAVYGNTCGTAMEKAVMQITIITPQKASKAIISDSTMGTYNTVTTNASSTPTTVFTIPLAALLTKTTTTTYSVSW